MKVISAILAHAPARWRTFLVAAVFTGLRASELRGLRWADVNLRTNEIQITQRADRFNAIGKPKSAVGERTVPFGTIVANTLKEWKLAGMKSDLNLVFCTSSGQPLEHSNVLKASLLAAQVKAGIRSRRQAEVHGPPCPTALRRQLVYRSRPPAKRGRRTPRHRSSITMTYDRYGHLFPRGDDPAPRSTLRSGPSSTRQECYWSLKT